MADLYGDMETRVPVTLGPSPEDALSEIALWGARTGARGGTLTGRGLRGAAGAASRLPGDPLAADRGFYGAAFASDNPYTALTYAGRKGKVYPFRIDPRGLLEHIPVPTAGPPEPMFWDDGELLHSGFDEFVDEPPPLSYHTETVPRDYRNFPRVSGQMEQSLPVGFGHTESGLSPGHAKVTRNVVDPIPGGGLLPMSADPLGAAELPSEVWAYSPGTRTIPAGAPLSREDLGDLGRRAAATGAGSPVDALDVVVGDPRFRSGEGRLLFRGLDPDLAPPKPPLASRIGRGLLRFGKGALHPAGILADALLGSAAGGGGAAAGYASASPETGGTISIPSGSDILREIPSDPLRGGVVGQETMLRAIMAADERKEALRQQYIDEINTQYGPGTVQQGAKIDEISRYLGPVAF